MDVNKAHPYSLYINELAHGSWPGTGQFFQLEGSITGPGRGYAGEPFGPGDLAPGPTVPLAFLDRDEISLGRNYLYVATEVGLLEADRYAVRPQDTLSRGAPLFWITLLATYKMI